MAGQLGAFRRTIICPEGSDDDVEADFFICVSIVDNLLKPLAITVYVTAILPTNFIKMKTRTFLILAIFLVQLFVTWSALDQAAKDSCISYLQYEQATCSQAQQNIIQTLKKHQISLGLESHKSRATEVNSNQISDRIITSTKSKPIECRISLGPAPPGAKCIAPCGCTGSQKWVQFSVVNKLRRKDPQQWITCPTCREPFKFSMFSNRGGVEAAVVGLLLEKLVILRTILFTLLGALLHVTSSFSWLSRYLVSRSFWQMYPNLWMKIARLPLPFKFWGGKILLSTLWEKYLLFEKNWIVNYLADLETKLIEERLPDIRP